jgi:predicted kinase
VLIVVSGLPGSGKSTLADELGRVLHAPVLSVDPIESALLRAGIERSFEAGFAAYLVAEVCADQFLGAGLDVLVDAVSGVEPAREMWRALAARHGTPLRVVACVLNPAEATRRLATRSRGLAMGEPSAGDVRTRAAEWTPWLEPHLVVDSIERRETNVARVLAWLNES